MNRRLLLVGIALVVLVLAVLPRPLGEPMDRTGTMSVANDLYERGNFIGAAQLYQQLADEGYGDMSLYYNLANAHYKSGDLGRAILNYHRAARLAPRDPDIQANLEIARDKTVDLLEADDESALASSIELPQFRLTLDELALTSLGLWILLALLLLVLLLAGSSPVHRWTKYASFAVAVFLVMATASLGSTLYAEAADQKVIVIAESVDVVSGPGPQFEAEFALHSGAEASLVETRGDWARLALPGGQLQGWVPAGAVEPVVP